MKMVVATKDIGSSFCFKVKEPVKLPCSVRVSYVWHTMAFYTIWTPSKQLVVLCFGLPATMKCQLSHLGQLTLDNPVSFHAILSQKVATLYDASLWSWRDIVRDIEKVRARIEEKIHTKTCQNRTSSQDPRPDYVMMHELARHTIHSSEMLAVAADTITNIIQEHEILFNDNASSMLPATPLKQTMRELRSHLALLKSLYLRSKALEDRLRNEINLVCVLIQSEAIILKAQ